MYAHTPVLSCLSPYTTQAGYEALHPAIVSLPLFRCSIDAIGFPLCRWWLPLDQPVPVSGLATVDRRPLLPLGKERTGALAARMIRAKMVELQSSKAHLLFSSDCPSTLCSTPPHHGPQIAPID